MSQSPTEKRIHVSIDPRIELLSVVLKLSGYGSLYEGRISDTSSPYLDDMERHFAKYAGHEAIRYFQGINEFISGDLPVTIVLYLSKPPALESRTPFDDMVRARVKDGKVLTRYVEALRKFAAGTCFAEFFSAHMDYYSSLIAPHEKSIREGNSLSLLEDYFGSGQPAYYVIFAPLLQTIAFGPRVHLPDGTLEPYCVFPSVGVEAGPIRFKTGKALQSRLWHEFGHSFINPLVDRHQAELFRSAALMERIVYNTKASYGKEWLVNVYEHVVRAVTTRLTCQEYGEDAGEKETLAHEEQGFPYIRDLCARLEAYEKARGSYPTLAEFFPELVEVFRALSRKAGFA